MEQVYALGITCIEFIQEWFEESEQFFETVNHLSNPHYLIEGLFPIVSIVDSVFAAQLLLCMAFGGWLNAVMKWWLLEDRPYWWVRETTFYADSHRPRLRQFGQTCETGPGCPSGHTTACAMTLLLIIMWISHVMHDRKCYVYWWKWVAYPACACALLAVMLARMFVAAHFPHQCLLGALVGSFLAPALCIYVSDPFVWQYGAHARRDPAGAVPGPAGAVRAQCWHVLCTALTVAISALTYYSLKVCGWDPQWTVKLAFSWCEDPAAIHVSTTPLFALVQCTGGLLAWALAVTPRVAQYRHYTQNRSLVISAFTTGVIMYVMNELTNKIPTHNTFVFYALHFAFSTLKPALFLRFTPAVAMWPYTGKDKKD